MAFFSQTSSAVSRTRATSGAEVALGPREKFRSKVPLRLTSQVPTGWGWGGKRGGEVNLKPSMQRKKCSNEVEKSSSNFILDYKECLEFVFMF